MRAVEGDDPHPPAGRLVAHRAYQLTDDVLVALGWRSIRRVKLAVEQRAIGAENDLFQVLIFSIRRGEELNPIAETAQDLEGQRARLVRSGLRDAEVDGIVGAEEAVPGHV